MRTITVRGVGSIAARPDYVVLAMAIDATAVPYEKAMAQATDRIHVLETAIVGLGFEKADLKTTNFQVRTEYESKRNAKGSLTRIFAGYTCSYRLKLSFDFEQKRLAEVLSAIGASSVAPELSVAFTVKEPEKLNEELLVSATQNARAKAETLCQAAGAALGELISIDYNWTELNVISPCRYEAGDMPLPVGAPTLAAEIEPDDIPVRDTATFVWTIQ
jgi:hypothetical protein